MTNPLPQSIRNVCHTYADLRATDNDDQQVDGEIYETVIKTCEWLYSFLISRGDEFDEKAVSAFCEAQAPGRRAYDIAIREGIYIGARWQFTQSLAEKAALKLKLMFAESIAQTEEQTRKHAQKEITRLRETIAVIKTQPNLAQVKILCDSALERK